MSASSLVSQRQDFDRTLYTLRQQRKPIFAVVNGLAYGGGCEIAQSTDFIIASDTATFGQPEAMIGLAAGGGSPALLPRVLPPGKALQMLMTGDPITADEAHRLGMVNELHPPGDGEQVSFLVPARFAAALLARSRDAAPLKTPAFDTVAAQLGAHQEAMTTRFIEQGWKPATHPTYKMPVPPDVFMRCWGSSEPSRSGGLDIERSDCVMDTRIFVGEFNTGALSLRHESYDGAKLGTMRFAARHSQSFRNESFARLGPQHQTKPQCREDYVDRGGLPLRAVVCLRAYKKLPQLYDVSVLVATLDQPQAGVQGRFDAQGVSFANALRLSKHYLEAYAWVR